MIRQFFGLGLSNTDIAHANEEWGGWRPSDSAVSRKLSAMGLPKRRASHRELIPWRINPQHAHSQIYYALQAVSRRQQKIPLSPQDVWRAQWLRDLLTRNGEPRVVDYDPVDGWRLVRALETDSDIIRHPDSPR